MPQNNRILSGFLRRVFLSDPFDGFTERADYNLNEKQTEPGSGS